MNIDHNALLEVYTNQQIANVPDIDPWEAGEYAPHLVAAFLKHRFDDRRQVTHRLVQSGYETGCSNRLEEFGGRSQAVTLGYSGGADFYGHGTAMTTHDYNYEEVGKLMGLPNLAQRLEAIGCKNDDQPNGPGTHGSAWSPVWPSRLRRIRDMARVGDAAFDEIMQAWLGASVGHPSYWDRWVLYRAMINNMPRPLFVDA